MTDSSLGKFIRRCRLYRDPKGSLTEMAEFIGVPASRLSAIEMGKERPSETELHLAAMYVLGYDQAEADERLRREVIRSRGLSRLLEQGRVNA